MMEEKLYKNRDWLYKHYIEIQESTRVMARKAGCTNVTIGNWLYRFDIPVRTSGEGAFLATRNYLNLSDKLFNLLEGELLGDGCIAMHGSRSAAYHHGSKYKEYLVWLSKTFTDLGLEQSGRIYKYWNEGYETFIYRYQSRSYPELVPLREWFYPEGKKIVPQDLVLTPTMARQWFLGDGGLYNRAGGRSDIDFSTNDFDKISIDHLLEELRDKGFKVSHRTASNTIGMSTKSVKDFLGYIGLCPIDCYQYKWDYQDNRKSAGAQKGQVNHSILLEEIGV